MSVGSGIPTELRSLPQWVVWRFETRRSKPTKVPYRPLPEKGGRASTADPTTWGSFDAATAALSWADGVGFVFKPDDPYTGVDLDACRDPATGALDDRAAGIVTRIDSYTEASPSGAGVHIILRAAVPGTRKRGGHVEIYDRRRFFCMTGSPLPDAPTDIHERQTELDAVYAELFPPTTPMADKVSKVDQTPNGGAPDDRDLIAHATQARNGEKFRDLWTGRWHGRYPSHSEADAALCSMLSFWTERDALRVDRLFRQSGLYREKWDRADYRERTVDVALNSAVCTPAPRPAAAEQGAGIEPRIVTLEEFVGVVERGAASILGPPSEAIFPEDGDVMVYGDGGAGKTTLLIDGACHLAAGDEWLGIPVLRPVRVLLIENEGPRPWFRVKLGAKLAGWHGSPLEGRVVVYEEPWGEFSFADAAQRERLAADIRRLQLDVVIVGPTTRVGMDEAGTLQQVRDFMQLVADVRRQAGRPVVFVLVHHENKGGKVSGAWEGAGDTLLHVSGQGQGSTRLYIQKARWASSYHATTLRLMWTDGEGFAIADQTEITDTDLAEQIIAAIGVNPGTGWTRIEEATPGVKAQRRRQVRDGLLAEGRIVNINKIAGQETWLDHCPERKQARLFSADDPAIQHLRPDPDADGTQFASPPGEGAEMHLRPASRYKRDAVGTQTQFPSPAESERHPE
jgi:putative DNA primase/helicase